MPHSILGPRSQIERPHITGVRFVDHPDQAAFPSPAPAVIARRRAILAGVVVFCVLFSGGLGVIRALPTRYAASAVVSFMPRPGSGIAADTVQMAGQKYVVVATSATTLEAAGSSVGLPPDELADATSAALDAGTGNVEITVEWPDREHAVNAANAVASALVRRSALDQLVVGEATAPAVASRIEVKPARMLLLIASGLAAALAAVLAWAVVKAHPRLRRMRLVRPRPRTG